MVDHHVAIGARLFVEPDPRADGERLGHVDLHVRDVLTVPDGFEEPVRESEREDVERCLFPEEVVDPEDLVLVEDRVHRVVQRDRAGEIGPERLLHDDARAVGHPRLPEQGQHVAHGRGRDAEVEEPRDAVAERRLELVHHGGERVGAGRLPEVRESRRKVVPVVVGDTVVRELVERCTRVRPEALVVEFVERRPQDLVLGEQSRLGQVEQPRDELAPREIPGRTEQDHDVRAQW